MNARQKAKRLKKEVEMYKRLASRPSFIIPPHIETIQAKYHMMDTSMYPVDLVDGLVEQTKKHLSEEIGKYLYEQKWLNIRIEHDRMLDTDVMTAWIRIVVDSYDY